MRFLFKKAVIAMAAAGVILTLPLGASANPAEIYASDACSPSFNEATGMNLCNRQGGTPFDVFIQQVTQNKRAGAWHFSAPQVNVRAGDSLTVENRGGETHTLSPVSQFGGGGIVPDLNLIMFGTTTPPLFFIDPGPAQLRAGWRGDDDPRERPNSGDAPVHLCDPSVDGRDGGRQLTSRTCSGAEGLRRACTNPPP